METRP